MDETQLPERGKQGIDSRGRGLICHRHEAGLCGRQIMSCAPEMNPGILTDSPIHGRFTEQ